MKKEYTICDRCGSLMNEERESISIKGNIKSVGVCGDVRPMKQADLCDDCATQFVAFMHVREQVPGMVAECRIDSLLEYKRDPSGPRGTR